MMELETDCVYTVMHHSAVVESEVNALDLLLPERTSLNRLINDRSQYALKPASASRLARGPKGASGADERHSHAGEEIGSRSTGRRA
jgi:hypothetical protein